MQTNMEVTRRRSLPTANPHLLPARSAYPPCKELQVAQGAHAEKDVVANHAGVDLGGDIGEAKGAEGEGVDAGSANFNRAVGGEGGAARAGLQAEGAPSCAGTATRVAPVSSRKRTGWPISPGRCEWPARLRCRTSWLAPAATTRLRWDPGGPAGHR